MQKVMKHYKICEEIGRGKFGTVFRCCCLLSGDNFACKSINKRLLSDPLEQQRVVRESSIMRLLSGHRHILFIYRAYEDDESLNMILDLCSSSNLYDRVLQSLYTEPEAAVVMSQLMEAIAHCHLRGVAHRDIKPENILFDHVNDLKIADFGLSEFFSNRRKLIGRVGSPTYMAPEVISGRQYTEKVDVWSAGVVFYIMLAGVEPFQGETPEATLAAVLHEDLQFPEETFQSVSPEAKDLIRKMVCKDDSMRFSAAQVLRHPWLQSKGCTIKETDSRSDESISCTEVSNLSRERRIVRSRSGIV